MASSSQQRWAYPVLMALVVVALGTSGAPAPLYGIYAHEWGFAPLTTTIVFAAYAAAALVAVLVSMTVVDRWGRRPILLTGISIMIGGKRSLKIGDLMGIMVKPFMKLETDEDFDKLNEFAQSVVEFFADNALEHERVGETIDRIGLPAFLEALDLDPDPNMVNHPRTSSYVRTDDFDEEAAKYFERKAAERAAE